MNKWILAVLIGLTPVTTLAADSDYKYCPVGGYLYGQGDDFMGGLVIRILVDSGTYSDPICSAAWRDGYETGQYISKHGKFRDKNDEKLTSQAGVFKEKVQKFIIRGAGLK